MRQIIAAAFCAVLFLVATQALGARYHSADHAPQDGVLGLADLLRVVQLFNTPSGFSCASASPDGFTPGDGPRDCAAHDADISPRDWRLSLGEVLRVIQFYSGWQHRYRTAIGTEDGFEPLPYPYTVECDRQGDILIAGEVVNLRVTPADWVSRTAILSVSSCDTTLEPLVPTGIDGNGYSYRLVMPDVGLCSYYFTVSGHDLAGNPVTYPYAAWYSVDNRPPTVRASLVNDHGIWRYRITYELADRVDLTLDDITLTHDPLLGFTPVLRPDAFLPTAFWLTLDGLQGEGRVSLDIAPGAATNQSANADAGYHSPSPAYVNADETAEFVYLSLAAPQATFTPGGAVTLNMHLDKAPDQSAPLALAIRLDAPAGWSYAAVGGPAAPTLRPQPGANDGAFTFAWLSAPEFPTDFTVTLNAPANGAEANIAATALLRFVTGAERATAVSEVALTPQ